MNAIRFLLCCIFIYDSTNLFHSDAKQSSKCANCPVIQEISYSHSSTDIKFGKPVVLPCKHDKAKKTKKNALKKHIFARKKFTRERRTLFVKNANVDTFENGDYHAVNISLPNVPEHNMTEIATKHFMIRIITGNSPTDPMASKDTYKGSNIVNKKVVVFDKPVERYQHGIKGWEENTKKDDDEKLDEDDKQLLKEAIMGEIITRITKLPKYTSDKGTKVKSDHSGKAGGQNRDKSDESAKVDFQKFNKTQILKNDDRKLGKLKALIYKNKRLTDMFVTFVTELSGRLKLDNLQVAEKLISHTGSEKKTHDNDASGTERDNIPLMRKQYTKILDGVQSFVDDEVDSAIIKLN